MDGPARIGGNREPLDGEPFLACDGLVDVRVVHISADEIDEEAIEKLKEGDILESTFTEFAEQSPELYEALIAERDRYMAVRLREDNDGQAGSKVLVVIGAGAVGMEFASLFARFGSEVTVIEMLPRILPLEDEEISAEADKVLAKQMSIYTGAKTEAVLKTLTPREEKVIKMRFGVGDGSEHTLEEVGKKLGVTRERVRQIEAKAVAKLQSPSRADRLAAFLKTAA